MKKVILIFSMLLFFTVSISADEHVYTSDEEFFRAMDAMDEKIELEKKKQAEYIAETATKRAELAITESKLQSLIKLEKTIDKLAKKLAVNE